MSRSAIQRLLQEFCPHWYWPIPDYGHQIMMEVTKREKCRICGHFRIYAKVPKPHPSRDKDQMLQDLQQPGHEIVVQKWLPYGRKGP